MHNRKVNKTRYDDPRKPMKQTTLTVKKTSLTVKKTWGN